MTLYVVPALYSVFDSVTRRIGSAARIEREATQVLADLQAEDIERFRHRRGGKGAAGAAPGTSSPAAD